MTNDEMERAMDFILKSQARAEARIEQAEERQARTDEQLARTDEQLRQLAVRMDALADTQTNFLQAVTRHIEEQGRVNESLRATDATLARLSESLFTSDESLRVALTELAARQTRMGDALAGLAEAQASSERRLEALIRIVEEGRRGDG